MKRADISAVKKPACSKASLSAMKKPACSKVGLAVLKKPACSRDATRQIHRHKGIVVALKDELATWVGSLEKRPEVSPSTGKSRTFECIFCGRVADRIFNMKRHAESHAVGRLSSFIGSLESHQQVPHPVFAEVIRALYDNDQLVGIVGGSYAARAKTLLMEWTGLSAGASDDVSIFTAMGNRDSNLTLVLTGNGPQYWTCDDNRLKDAKEFANNQRYTRCFANAYLRHLLQQDGVYHRALRAMKAEWQKAGCEVTQLLDRQKTTLANMSCELMESHVMGKYRAASQNDLCKRGEYQSISVDGTYKLSLKVVGQSRTHKHNYITVVGTRGSPLGLVGVRGEAPAVVRSALQEQVPEFARTKVEHVALDDISTKMHDEMAALFPSLKGCSLDSMHLAFAVDSAAKARRCKPTQVGFVMRAIMDKFNVPCKSVGEELYTGKKLPGLTDDERKAVDLIWSGAMPKKEATRILKAMDPNAPMSSLKEFATLLAATVKVFPERMDTKLDKTTLRGKLAYACTPSRFQWYMNNSRHRKSIPAKIEEFMAAGTTRNEQFHRVLNAAYRTTILVSRQVLDAQLATWLTSQMAIFLVALKDKLSKGKKAVDIKPFVTSSTCLMTTKEWQLFLAKGQRMWEAGEVDDRQRRVKRKGPSTEQDDIAVAIQNKKVKRAQQCLPMNSG